MLKNKQTRGAALALSVLAAGVLSACGSLAPVAPYSRPALQLPSADTTAGNADLRSWWTGFNDPVLNALLDEAQRNNQDLALATARVIESQASTAQSHANLFPTVDLTANTARRKISENTATYASGFNPVYEDRQIGLSASYEIDFWGKYAKADEAARARLLAQSATRGNVLITLYANVAQAYFALRGADAQARLASQVLESRQETLRLQQRRLAVGLVGPQDILTAQADVVSAQSAVQQARQSLALAESTLAVLVGRQPADIVKPALARGNDLGALYAAQKVPEGLRSDLLTARPDVVAAEQTLVAAHGDIAQARAAYFPSLTLTASAGQESKSLSNLFDPASVFWNLMGNLTQPIFRAGALDALMSAANAREQEALAQYTQTVQNAFKDAHDALTNVVAGRVLADNAQERLRLSGESLRLAQARFKTGTIGSLDLLSAQRDQAQAEASLVDAQRVQLTAVVAVYKALGGGWTPSTATETAAK